MAIPFPNLTLAAPSTATSGATVNVPFSIGGSASTGLSLYMLGLVALGGFVAYKLLK